MYSKMPTEFFFQALDGQLLRMGADPKNSVRRYVLSIRPRYDAVIAAKQHEPISVKLLNYSTY